jgi:hypothetical protein
MEGVVSEYRESPACKVMSEAIDLAIAEESPYPEQALFLNSDIPVADRDREMERAAQDGYSVVLVSPDGKTQIVAPEEIIGPAKARRRSAQLGDQRADHG